MMRTSEQVEGFILAEDEQRLGIGKMVEEVGRKLCICSCLCWRGTTSHLGVEVRLKNEGMK